MPILRQIKAERVLLDTLDDVPPGCEREWAVEFIQFVEHTSMSWLTDYASNYAKGDRNSPTVLVRFLVSEPETKHFWKAYHLWMHTFWDDHPLGPMCKKDCLSELD